MDPKPQKPPLLFASPFSMLTQLAFQLWGFGKPPAESSAPEKQVAVAVIPTKDAQSPPPKVARAQSGPKRTKAKVRGKSRSKRARRAKA